MVFQVAQLEAEQIHGLEQLRQVAVDEAAPLELARLPVRAVGHEVADAAPVEDNAPVLYYDLRKPALVGCVTHLEWWQVVVEAAQLISRYHFTFAPDADWIDAFVPPVPAPYQRHLLERILTSRAPANGLRLLHGAGIVDSWWPELAAMAGVPHAKDHHPEGDVWEHTLATFAHRKAPDLVLSLGLLLHDVGKPRATPQEGKRFFAHAEIGARVAQRFLGRLGFAPRLIDAVAFLGRNHMMPAALGRVRPEHAEELMSSDLFPHLLELYRADMMSSFASPEPYYHACSLYRRHLARPPPAAAHRRSRPPPRPPPPRPPLQGLTWSAWPAARSACPGRR